MFIFFFFFFFRGGAWPCNDVLFQVTQWRYWQWLFFFIIIPYTYCNIISWTVQIYYLYVECIVQCCINLSKHVRQPSIGSTVHGMVAWLPDIPHGTYCRQAEPASHSCTGIPRSKVVEGETSVIRLWEYFTIKKKKWLRQNAWDCTHPSGPVRQSDWLKGTYGISVKVKLECKINKKF